MSEHTPGPWFFDPDNMTIHTSRRHPTDDLADIHGTTPEEEANGRLMAAAPELLTWSTDLISRLRALDSIMNALPKDAVETLQKLEDAIAKATGGGK